jgi:PAS domain S-box-containing protein
MTSPPHALKETLEKRMVLGLGVVFLVLAGMVWIAVRNTRESIASSDWVNHTHEVILQVDAIGSALHAAEASQRSFLLTGDLWEQAAYRAAYAAMTEHLLVAKVLTADNPHQRQQLTILEGLITCQVDFAKSLAQARQEKGPEEVKRLLSTDAGHPILAEIGKLIGQVKRDENELLQQRDRTSHAQARATRWILAVGLGLNFLLLGLIFYLVRADLAWRRQAATALREANDHLEVKVKERTAELAQSNESLVLENLKRQWAHDAIERLYRHSDLIINSIAEGIYVVSRRGNIIRVNPAGAAMVGWDNTELTGRPLSTILRRPPSNGGPLPWEADPLNRAMKDGHDLYGVEGELGHKDGSSFPIRYSSHPVRDHDKIVGAVVTCVDLTFRRRPEQ